MEMEEEYANDFENWNTLKLVNTDHTIIGAIRYREDDGIIDVGQVL